MIKRPLNSQFSGKVKAGEKITTIRYNPWPVGVPIMLYNWQSKPYRSRHQDVAAVVVSETQAIKLARTTQGNIISIPLVPRICGNKQLWECEGFDSYGDFCDWFRKLIKPGQTITKTLMRFDLVNAEVRDASPHATNNSKG